MLPDWPPGTVVVLVTNDRTPYAIPVSAVVRSGPDRILVGLADGRGSLARLRRDPSVAVTVLSADVAVTVRGRATVLEASPADGVTAVEIIAEAVDDHLRPTFVLESGVAWHWTDDGARERDCAVRDGLVRLARERR
jgi:nitroimidazol reductase NimA-like FMN-containing flavoprotein (pyridoxamine 5'-phosphate oxidase superfamily)